MCPFLSSNQNENQNVQVNKKQQGPKHLKKVSLMCGFAVINDE